MPIPFFCPHCGNNDHDGFIEEIDNIYKVYRCQICYYIIDKVSIDLLYNQKYQRTLGASI